MYACLFEYRFKCLPFSAELKVSDTDMKTQLFWPTRHSFFFFFFCEGGTESKSFTSWHFFLIGSTILLIGSCFHTDGKDISYFL